MKTISISRFYGFYRDLLGTFALRIEASHWASIGIGHDWRLHPRARRPLLQGLIGENLCRISSATSRVKDDFELLGTVVSVDTSDETSLNPFK